MRIQDMPTKPHREGCIYVNKVPGGGAQFAITQNHHESFLSTSAPLLVQHPVMHRLFRENRLQSIPVKVLFDTPESNIGGRYEAWSDLHEWGPVCLGDGAQAKALDVPERVWRAMACKGPSLCSKALSGVVNCRFKARMQVQLEIGPQDTGYFDLGTSSLNSYLSILGSLKTLRAQHGSLRKLSLRLMTWLKSTRASGYESFACARLALDGVVPASGPPLSADWEACGREEQRKWLQECIPTEAEQMPSRYWAPMTAPIVPRKANGSAVPARTKPEAIWFQRAIALNLAAGER